MGYNLVYIIVEISSKKKNCRNFIYLFRTKACVIVVVVKFSIVNTFSLEEIRGTL